MFCYSRSVLWRISIACFRSPFEIIHLTIPFHSEMNLYFRSQTKMKEKSILKDLHIHIPYIENGKQHLDIKFIYWLLRIRLKNVCYKTMEIKKLVTRIENISLKEWFNIKRRKKRKKKTSLVLRISLILVLHILFMFIAKFIL